MRWVALTLSLSLLLHLGACTSPPEAQSPAKALPAAGPIGMRYEAIKGGVEARPAEGMQWSRPSLSSAILPGSQLRTLGQASCIVNFEGAARMLVSSGTTCTIAESERRDGIAHIRVTVRNGTVDFQRIGDAASTDIIVEPDASQSIQR